MTSIILAGLTIEPVSVVTSIYKATMISSFNILKGLEYGIDNRDLLPQSLL